MKKRTYCKFVIVSIRVKIVRLVRIKAYRRKRFGKIPNRQAVSTSQFSGLFAVLERGDARVVAEKLHEDRRA